MPRKKDEVKISFGRQGEDIAARYLKTKGYKILKQNFYIRGGEIDIIALDKDTLVFIEVKTRASQKYGLPEESITPTKLKYLKHAAEVFCATNPKLPQLRRMDAVCIEFDETKALKRIELIKNILS